MINPFNFIVKAFVVGCYWTQKETKIKDLSLSVVNVYVDSALPKLMESVGIRQAIKKALHSTPPCHPLYPSIFLFFHFFLLCSKHLSYWYCHILSQPSHSSPLTSLLTTTPQHLTLGELPALNFGVLVILPHPFLSLPLSLPPFPHTFLPPPPHFTPGKVPTLNAHRTLTHTEKRT